MLVVICNFSACGIGANQTPDLYNNQKYTATIESDRISDINYCLDLADKNVALSNKTTVVAKRTLLGAIAGTATGAISGSILGDLSENVAAGAAVGTVVGLLQSLLDMSERNPYYERFTEHCLQTKGYEITGWSEK